jgi:two-component system, OmpR family, response regulator
MRVLIVEDEIDLAAAMKKALEEEHFAVDAVHDGESGLLYARSVPYDAILLDLMLPKMDGWTVLRQLRASVKTPVLILTARDALRDKVQGLDAGADDYLTKPFALAELLARLRALIRRAAGQPAPVLRLRDVEIDTAAGTVRKAGEPVPLSAKEYALLELLVRHRGKLVTRAMVFDHIYDEEADALSNVVDVHVSRLRKKLGPDLIETRRGQGYIIHV